MLELALDGLLIVLLVLCLALGLKLHLALRRLRHDSTDFDRLIGAIDAASARARAALDGLKQTAAEAGGRLADDVEQAQRLLDDLRFLCERGDCLADRLAEQIEAGRGQAPAPAVAEARRRPVAPAAADLERTLRSLR